jgi:hypothetical protein
VLGPGRVETYRIVDGAAERHPQFGNPRDGKTESTTPAPVGSIDRAPRARQRSKRPRKWGGVTGQASAGRAKSR